MRIIGCLKGDPRLLRVQLVTLITSESQMLYSLFSEISNDLSI